MASRETPKGRPNMVVYTRLHNRVHSVLYNPNPVYTAWSSRFAESGFELGRPIDHPPPESSRIDSPPRAPNTSTVCHHNLQGGPTFPRNSSTECLNPLELEHRVTLTNRRFKAVMIKSTGQRNTACLIPHQVHPRYTSSSNRAPSLRFRIPR